MSDYQSILILAALAQEEQALLAEVTRFAGSQALVKASLSAPLGLEMTCAKIGERSITVVKTGIGSVNAALALMLAQEREPVDSVVLLGVGGALTPELDVGDFVISSRVLQHDYFYSFDHGDERIRPGSLILSSQEAIGHVAPIDADRGLVDWLGRAELRAESKEPVLTGAILSGNEFVGRVDRKRAVGSLLPDAMLVDMEAAGVAQLADRLGIPFVVGKTVADRFNPDGTIEADFRACLDAACTHAAAVMHSLL